MANHAWLNPEASVELLKAPLRLIRPETTPQPQKEKPPETGGFF